MLTKDQRDYIIRLINEDKELPGEFKNLLFPTNHKEYELTYSGKIREEDLLANEDGVFPVPLQVEKAFDNEENKKVNDTWKNMIVLGDNLQFLKTIYENKDILIKDKVKGKVKLIYIDPPFATSDEFQNNEGAKAYNDKKKGAEFVEFLRTRLIMAREILADDGCIYVHLDTKMSHYIKVVMDEIFGKNYFQNEIVWNYASGGVSKKWFGKKHDTILLFSKSSNYTFNLIKEKSYNRDFKAYRFKGVDEFQDELGLWYTYRNMIDVWNINIVGRTSKERINYPTQKPEALLERIISASSNEGDIIFDFFGGSGTTMAVAEKLGRRWITCDLGKLAYFTMQKRILQIQDSKSLDNSRNMYNKKAKSFITASLGSYDLEKTLELERNNYLEFVAGLFEIQLKDFTVSGFKFEGKRNNDPVIIYDYKKFKNSIIDENYLTDLHRNIGDKIGDRVYIVTPINFVDFIDDFIEIESTQYYFLKIPYHIINELHKKPFIKVRQPQSKSRVNEIEEAIGFHFNRPPEVKVEIQKYRETIDIRIAKFQTTELQSIKAKEEKAFENFETLSAIFIDKTYNGKYFDMDEVYFVDELIGKKPKSEKDLKIYLKELSENGVHISLKSNEVDKQIMLVFTDIFGNDFTQTFEV